MFDFDNIGKKIKWLAKLYCGIGTTLSIIVGLFFIFRGATEDMAPTVLIGVVCLTLGSIVSWISSWCLYGFGQLIDNSDTVVFQNNKMYQQSIINNYKVNNNENNDCEKAPHKWRCPNCGNMISEDPCPICNKK